MTNPHTASENALSGRAETLNRHEECYAFRCQSERPASRSAASAVSIEYVPSCLPRSLAAGWAPKPASRSLRTVQPPRSRTAAISEAMGGVIGRKPSVPRGGHKALAPCLDLGTVLA